MNAGALGRGFHPFAQNDSLFVIVCDTGTFLTFSESEAFVSGGEQAGIP